MIRAELKKVLEDVVRFSGCRDMVSDHQSGVRLATALVSNR